MTEEVKLQERQEVLIFVYNPYSQIEEPIAKGIVVSNELSDDMSYHGSPSYYRIYTVKDENGEYHKGTYMTGNMGCGACFFRTIEDQKRYLENKIEAYEENIQEYKDKIKDIEARLKEYEVINKNVNIENLQKEVKPKDEKEPMVAQNGEGEEEQMQDDVKMEVGMEEETETPNVENLVNPLLWGNISYEDVEIVGRTKPKYTIGEIVNLNTWVGMKYGFEVKDIKVTFHNRLGKYTWGYYLYKEGESTSFSFTYIPEGYLRKVEEEKETN